MSQMLRELGSLVFNFNSEEHATGSEGQVFILAVGCAWGAGLSLDSEPRPVLVQIQRKSDGLIDLLDFFRRESRDSLLDQNFGQSRDIVEIDAQRTGIPSVRSKWFG
jgi:hypothetical protein